ncbi:hypothetical protein C943_00325 [Mariniradius saccharolyticus AK6]|uniref:Uncharacterized protein n=1 Tax=Mariniradius saccharolyticus AK6 TaxID=1239962 RepID=M7XER8_9BACT|nr:hypothetical protein C943_00325 [Mariniradius saccharolyticus AK6]
MIAFSLDLNLVKTQNAMMVSETPIKWVKRGAFESPNILPTICSCLGTRPSTLQKNPFTSHTNEIAAVNR